MITIKKLTRKLSSLIASFFLLLFACNENESKKVAFGNSIVLTLSKQDMGELNSKIDVCICNYSNEDAVIPTLFIPEDHFIRFFCVNERGDTSKFVGVEKKIKLDEFDMFRYPPKSKICQEVNLSNFYILEAGEYSISGEYSIDENRFEDKLLWNGTLTSNTIAITIK